MIIAVGSGNEAKLEAVWSACALLFGKDIKIIPCNVDSGVRRQPFGDEECITGARLRSSRAIACCSDADYGIGIENGICCWGSEPNQEYCDRGWVVVQQKSGSGKCSQASSASIPISREVACYLQNHSDDGLGRLLCRVYSRTDVNAQEGYTGLATGNILDRTMVLTQAVICAFAPFVNALFFEKLQEAVKQ